LTKNTIEVCVIVELLVACCVMFARLVHVRKQDTIPVLEKAYHRGILVGAAPRESVGCNAVLITIVDGCLVADLDKLRVRRLEPYRLKILRKSMVG
jgi:hypothetical protein